MDRKETRIIGRRLIIVIFLVAALVATAIAITAFTHYLPSVNVASNNASFLTANCGTSANSPLTASPTSVAAGTGGLVDFSCGNTGALHVSLSGGSATPTFTLPSGYEAGTLNLVGHGSGGCNGQPPILGIGALTTGTVFTFNSNMVYTDFDYCAYIPTSTAAGTITAFTISWA